MATAVMDLYLGRRCVRGEVPVGSFTRISDLMNSGMSAFLGGRALSVPDTMSVAPGGWEAGGSDFAIPVASVRLLVPVVEPARDGIESGLLRDRERITVDLEVEEWHISGTLHLLDRVRWVDFLASSHGKFIPISGAEIAYGGPSEITRAPFVLVNGSRITALFAAA